MTLRDRRARDRRIAWLRGKPHLSAIEHDELDRLERAAAAYWRNLPRQIAAARQRLHSLTAYADEIGLGPC